MNIRETNDINTENPQWRKEHESLTTYFQNVFDEYQEGKIDFHEYKYKLVGSSSGLEYHINFKYSLYDLIDAWMEILEYCYLEKEWHKYGLEVGCFILEGLDSFPNKVFLPENSDLVRNNLTRYLDS